jgi:beta-N-acetylhexosaminidase
MHSTDLPLPQLCGQLLLGGFLGTELPSSFARGHRAGAILFRRNLAELGQAAELCAGIHRAASGALPLFVAVDQEGGRVTRLPEPFLTLPPMRQLGRIDDPDLTCRAGKAVGAELRALGFTLDLAPVLDVDSNPRNPVIGDRSFGSTVAQVARHALAFARGLELGGVGCCGKHFPGHGDTSLDSHLELPFVDHDLARLRQIELAPFAAAVRSGIPALMSAHVVFRALDPADPATLSRRVCSELLRGELGFDGVLFSDDLEMGAIARGFGIEQAAVQAIGAGCDVLLICRDAEQQARAHEALVREAERNPRFAERCREAARRSLDMRRSPLAWAATAAVDASRPTRSALEALVARTIDAPTSRALREELGRALDALPVCDESTA